MIAVRKTTDEQIFRIHIGGAAEHALRRTRCQSTPGKMSRVGSGQSRCVDISPTLGDLLLSRIPNMVGWFGNLSSLFICPALHLCFSRVKLPDKLCPLYDGMAVAQFSRLYGLVWLMSRAHLQDFKGSWKAGTICKIIPIRATTTKILLSLSDAFEPDLLGSKLHGSPYPLCRATTQGKRVILKNQALLLLSHAKGLPSSC